MERIAAQYERLYEQVTAAPLPSFPPAWMRRGSWLWAVLATSVHVVRRLGERIT